MSAVMNKGGNLALASRIQFANYIENRGEANEELAMGTFIAGFGKGKFKMCESLDAVDPEKEIVYDLKNSDSLIMFNGEVKTIGEVVANQREKDPLCKLAYYTMEEVPGKSQNEFTLVAKHLVAFVPSKPEADKTILQQTAIGAAIPCNKWEGSASAIVFSGRWAENGFMPIRPQVVSTVSATILPKTSLWL